MKNQTLTPITQMAAALVLAGSLFTATAGESDKKKSADKDCKQCPSKSQSSKSGSVEREIWAAVKAGKLSKEEAMKKLAYLKQKQSGHSSAQAKYQADYRELVGAVKAGKISEAEAKKKLAAIKQSLSGQTHDKRDHGKSAQSNERMAKYKAIEREIYGAVKAGKLSREEAAKKLAHVKRELFGQSQAKQSDRRPAPKAGHGKPDQPKRISREQAEKMNREIMEAVRAGKLSREEAHKKFQAIRNLMAGQQRPQSDRAPQARPDQHRKPATSDKHTHGQRDRNLAAEVDALRREVQALKRTLEALRRHHGDRRER